MGQPIGSWYGATSMRKRIRNTSSVPLAEIIPGETHLHGATSSSDGSTTVALPESSHPVASFHGLDRSVVRDVASFYEGLPTEDTSIPRGCLDIVRVRRDRPPFLQRRRAVSVVCIDEDDEDLVPDGDAVDMLVERTARQGIAVVYVDVVDGVCWELGCWPDLQDPSGTDVFQIVLDVLTETVGTCSIAKLRIRDNLHFLPGVCHGLDLLRHMSIPFHTRQGITATTVDFFAHPITGDSIEIFSTL